MLHILLYNCSGRHKCSGRSGTSHAAAEAHESTSETLEEQNMDWSPMTKYYRTHYEGLDTPNQAESSLSVTSLEDKD